MAIGPEDGVFVLYSNYPPCEPPFECPVDLAIARYDANGFRDASYGTGPGSLLQVREFTERKAFDLAVGPDGRAAVAAYDQNVGGVIVARFDAGGRLDGTFGIRGAGACPSTPSGTRRWPWRYRPTERSSSRAKAATTKARAWLSSVT